MAARRDIEHYSRATQWGGASEDDGSVVVLWGFNWSAAAFVASFAPRNGGSPAIVLGNAAPGAQGISAVLDPTYANRITGEIGPATIVTLQINAAAFLGLAWGSDTSKPLLLDHNLLVTPPGAPQRALRFGVFSLLYGI